MGKRQLEAFEALAFMRSRTNAGQLTTVKQIADAFRVDVGVADATVRQLVAREVVDFKLLEINVSRKNNLYFACDTADWESSFDGDFVFDQWTPARYDRRKKNRGRPPKNFDEVAIAYKNDEINLNEAARRCGCHRCTFSFWYKQTGFPPKKNGRKRTKIPEHVFRAVLNREIRAKAAAAEIGISVVSFYKAVERLKRERRLAAKSD